MTHAPSTTSGFAEVVTIAVIYDFAVKLGANLSADWSQEEHPQSRLFPGYRYKKRVLITHQPRLLSTKLGQLLLRNGNGICTIEVTRLYERDAATVVLG